MSLVDQVDPGGEKYITFAKRKLAWWKSRMLFSGARTLAKLIQVTDGSRIYFNSTYLGGGQFRDHIRITTGGLLGYLQEVANGFHIDALAVGSPSGGALSARYALVDAISPVGAGDASHSLHAWNKGGTGVINANIVARANDKVFAPVFPGISADDSTFPWAFSEARDWALYDITPNSLTANKFDYATLFGGVRLDFVNEAWHESHISYHFIEYDGLLANLGVSSMEKHASQYRPIFVSNALIMSAELFGAFLTDNFVRVSFDAPLAGLQTQIQHNARSFSPGKKWAVDITAVRYLRSIGAPYAAGWVSTNGSERNGSTDTAVLNLLDRTVRFTVLVHKTNCVTGEQTLVWSRNYDSVQPTWLGVRSPSGGTLEQYSVPTIRQTWVESGGDATFLEARVTTEGDVYVLMRERVYVGSLRGGTVSTGATVTVPDSGTVLFLYTGTATGVPVTILDYTNGSPWLCRVTGPFTERHVLLKNGNEVWSQAIAGDAPASAGFIHAFEYFFPITYAPPALGGARFLTNSIFGGNGTNNMALVYINDAHPPKEVEVVGIGDVFVETPTGENAGFLGAEQFSRDGSLKSKSVSDGSSKVIATENGEVVASYPAGEYFTNFMYDNAGSWYTTAAGPTYTVYTILTDEIGEWKRDDAGVLIVTNKAFTTPAGLKFGTVDLTSPPGYVSFIPFAAIVPGDIV